MSGSGSPHDDRRRRRHRSLWWEGLREYANGALWVMPSVAAVLALVTGWALSHVEVEPGSVISGVAFQGTADDARSLLIEVTGTVVTVIALTLGLTVVALQLSSTQFSPRLLRNFLRDRGTQVVLSVFIATFVYSAAGSFTVGLESGARTENYPRLAVSGSIVLLFASLGMVVYYADHLAHSIQIDAITRQVERNTRRAIDRLSRHQTDDPPPRAPDWAVALSSRRTGYVQTIHPELLLPLARSGATVCLRVRVGQHVIAGTLLGWAWAPSAAAPPPDRLACEAGVNANVRIGFERTGEQDVAFGLRQLIDIACKALSPAVNDPYTAVQAIDHLATIGVDLAAQPLGTSILADAGGGGRVIVPGNTFADYVFFVCSMIGRYGGAEVTVLLALVRFLGACASALPEDHPNRQRSLAEAAQMVLDDGEREIARPSDLESLRTAVDSLQARLR